MFAQRGKLGTKRDTEKRERRYLGETWIILHANNVERKSTLLGTVSAPLEPSLKKMRKNLGR